MVSTPPIEVVQEPPENSLRTSARSGRRSSARFILQTALTSVPLLVSDVVAVFVSIYLVHGILFLLGYLTLNPLLLAAETACIYVLISLLQRSYPGCGIHPAIELKNQVIALSMTFGILILTNFAHFQSAAVFAIILGSFMFALVLVPTLKSLTRERCSRYRWWGFAAVVFAEGDGDRVFQQLASSRRLGIKPLGIIGDPSSLWQDATSATSQESNNYLGVPEDSDSISDQLGAYWAVISTNDLQAMPEPAQQHVESQLAQFPYVLTLSSGNDLPSLWCRSIDLDGLPGTLFESRSTLLSQHALKRLSDLIIGSFVFAICLPLIAVLALLTKLTSRGPAFYAHMRLGKDRKRFLAWKIRTMHINADQLLAKYLASNPQLQKEWDETQKLKSDPRVTRIGRFLRATSLDELPQIWNVLRGEMSLVGPRPIVDDEIEKYQDTYRLYSQVTPGITGLWQVSGRNHTTYDERVAYDAYYVRNWSLWLDLYILVRTVRVVLFRQGAY